MLLDYIIFFFFFSSRRRHTRSYGDWSSDVCSSDLARSAPARVSETHVPDEIPNFRRYRRATFATPTLPSPIEAKSLAMPSDNRLRFDKEQRRSPIVPQPREPNPQDSISPTETELMTAVRTLQDQKLMSESKNLCLQKGTSPETISQRQK